jgi:hypothetical protein
MAHKKKASKKKRIGVFIYCGADMRRRLRVASAFTGRTLSGYMMQCVVPQLEKDEARMSGGRGS